jgi:hypothetical protein
MSHGKEFEVLPKRFWKVTAYVPWPTPVATGYYCGKHREKMLEFAAEFLEDTVAEWYDDCCGMTEEEFLEECDFSYEEISYEEFRDHCGY